MKRKDILADMNGCGVYLFVKVDEDRGGSRIFVRRGCTSKE